MIYYDKKPEEIDKKMEEIFNDLKNTPFVKTFYFDFFCKRLYPYYNNIDKKIIKILVKDFINLKINSNQLSKQYTLQCFYCHKKIFSPVSNLDNLPSSIECPFCGKKISVSSDYISYDLRYKFL